MGLKSQLIHRSIIFCRFLSLSTFMLLIMHTYRHCNKEGAVRSQRQSCCTLTLLFSWCACSCALYCYSGYTRLLQTSASTTFECEIRSSCSYRIHVLSSALVAKLEISKVLHRSLRLDVANLYIYQKFCIIVNAVFKCPL